MTVQPPRFNYVTLTNFIVLGMIVSACFYPEFRSRAYMKLFPNSAIIALPSDPQSQKIIAEIKSASVTYFCPTPELVASTFASNANATIFTIDNAVWTVRLDGTPDSMSNLKLKMAGISGDQLGCEYQWGDPSIRVGNRLMLVTHKANLKPLGFHWNQDVVCFAESRETCGYTATP